MLFNEPKLLKFDHPGVQAAPLDRFSALQRAEIAEIKLLKAVLHQKVGFSALQRAEIAEIRRGYVLSCAKGVSVLFNEPKLLKL